jgi:hypothetical protein
LLETLGETETKQLFFWMQPGESLDFPEGIADNSHFNENGAGKIAALVAEAIRESGVELAKYLI